jgi:hypothetical protein
MVLIVLQIANRVGRAEGETHQNKHPIAPAPVTG